MSPKMLHSYHLTDIICKRITEKAKDPKRQKAKVRASPEVSESTRRKGGSI